MKKSSCFAVITATCLLVFYIIWAVVTQSPPFIRVCGKPYFAYSRSCNVDIDISDDRQTKIYSLDSLKYMKWLNVLYIEGYSDIVVKDYSFLSSCTRLKEFHSSYMNIQDLSIFSELTDLEVLDLNMYCDNMDGGHNNVTDITVLTKLTKLKSISLNGKGLTDISALENLNALESLWIRGSSVADLNSLKNHTNLKQLFILDDKDLSDISALESCQSLEVVCLIGSNADNASVLMKLCNLKELRIDNGMLSAEQISILKRNGVNVYLAK